MSPTTWFTGACLSSPPSNRSRRSARSSESQTKCTTLTCASGILSNQRSTFKVVATHSTNCEHTLRVSSTLSNVFSCPKKRRRVSEPTRAVRAMSTTNDLSQWCRSDLASKHRNDPAALQAQQKATMQCNASQATSQVSLSRRVCLA